jgi:hypothetical protein
MANPEVTISSSLESTLKNLTGRMCSFGDYGECPHTGKPCAACGRHACAEHSEKCLDCGRVHCEECAATHACFCLKGTGDGYAGSGSDPIHDAAREAVVGVRQ